MTAKAVYLNALAFLGYSDNPNFKSRAIGIINNVYLDLWRIVKPSEEFEALEELANKIDLPDKVILSAMISGVAEKLALSEGDGELQQYFALDYDRNKAKLNTEDQVQDIFQ